MDELTKVLVDFVQGPVESPHDLEKQTCRFLEWMNQDDDEYTSQMLIAGNQLAAQIIRQQRDEITRLQLAEIALMNQLPTNKS